jgi:hypothetical protein
LKQAGVDNFHAGITQKARNNFDTSVVTIKSDLGNKHAQSH